MSLDRVRVAIVGCGRISDLHALGYQGLKEACIVAVCDTNRRLAEGKARAWGVDRIYTDYACLLTDGQFDLIELLVPHHLHAPMAVAAAEAGYHVSVQKPMAMSVAEATRMIDAAGRSRTVLRVYENFVFYPPYVRAKKMIDAGEIGVPSMIRIHVGTGASANAWHVPLRAWLWRFNRKQCGGGPLVWDHGYHLFSLARFLLGDVSRVVAWIDRTAVVPTQYLDAPATIMWQHKRPRCYGVMDFCHSPKMAMQSGYYADDDRVEVIGDRGMLFVNRCTARTVDLPEVMLFRDGRTTAVPVERVEWHDSFIDSTHHLVEVLRHGGEPVLSGEAGRAVLQFALAAQRSAAEGREIRPDAIVR